MVIFAPAGVELMAILPGWEGACNKVVGGDIRAQNKMKVAPSVSSTTMLTLLSQIVKSKIRKESHP